MRIEIAKYAGFCDGVKNAVEKSFSYALKTKETIYVDGHLIHNPQTIKMLENSGVTTFEDSSPLSELKDKKVIIRAHGVSPKRLKEIKNHAKEVVNLTCKYVADVQSIVKKYSKLGYRTIIIGKKEHPEVIGIIGFAEESHDGYVIIKESDIESLPKDNKNILIVSQTTMQNEVFDILSEKIKDYYKDSDNIIIKNTICAATSLRQEETKKLADRNDLVLVIGGKDSSNTKRLYEVASEIKKSYYIEKEEDLYNIDFSGYEKIGITAGASTPDWLIEEIANSLNTISSKGIEKYIDNILKFLTYSNLFFAIGAFFISFMISDVLKIKNVYQIGLLTACYYFIMSSINHYTNDSLTISNNPQYRFFIKIKNIMMIIILLSTVIMLLLAYYLGTSILILSLFSFVLGIAYNMSFKKNMASSRPLVFTLFKKLAYFKAWVITLAVTILLNGSYIIYYQMDVYKQQQNIIFSTVIIFFFMLMRQIFFDIRNSQSDKIAGTKSIISFININTLYKIFAVLPILLSLSIILAVYFGYYDINKLKYITVFLYAFILIFIMKKKNIIRNPYSFSFLIDSPTYIIGILALL